MTAEVLLDHVAWIRALARHLVADEQAAEDLVQEACVVALERTPRDVLRPRRWLAQVLRNLVRERRRGDGRRKAREERSARAEELEPTAGLVERATVHRRLVEAVLALDEPYRSTLLLRYFEELPPREIARRLDEPVGTVHSRLKRGLARLRERLDAASADDGGDGGDARRTWVLALLPLARGGEPSASAWALHPWTLLVNAKLALAAVLVLAVGTVAAVVAVRTAEPSSVRPRAVASAAPEVPVGVERPATDAPAVPGAPARREAAVPTPAAPDAEAGRAPEPAPAAPAALFEVVGRVLDALARPAAGIPVRLQSRPERAVSRADGRFRITTDQEEGRIVVADDAWVTIWEGVHRSRSSIEPVVVVAPSVDLAGVVLEGGGAPVAGAKVGLELPPGFEARFGEILDSTHPKSFAERTDEDGRFALDGVPGLEGGVLRAVRDGYRMATLPSSSIDDAGLVFVLERPERPASGALSGRVLDAAGAPVPEARVASGLASTLTDEDGLFYLALERAVTPDALRAVKAGHLPAVMERPFAPDGPNGGWPDHVELVLGGPPLSIRGRVVDRDGTPREGIKVWLADTTPFGTIGMMPASLESLAEGAEVPPEVVESELMLPEEDADFLWDFTYGGAPSTALWNWKLTGDDGGFELGGLADRDYRVRVLDRESLQLFTSDRVAAGTTDLLIELPELELFERVAGTVVDERGRPVPAVNVRLRIDPMAVRTRVFGGTVHVRMTESGPTAVTDAEGRFELADVPCEGTRLVLLSDAIVPDVFDLAPDEPAPGSLHLEVETRCHLQVELDDPELADGFLAVDAEGGHLSIHELSESSHDAYTSGAITAGRSSVVSVSGRAALLQLTKGGEVVEVVPLDLVPGVLNVVRP